jgi:hypothetical protein
LESDFLTAIFVRPFRCEKCDRRFFTWSIAKNPAPAKQPVASQLARRRAEDANDDFTSPVTGSVYQ